MPPKIEGKTVTKQAKWTKLTDEQRLDLEATVREHLALGRSTDPICREEIEPTIYRMYELIGEDRPLVLYSPGPLANCVWAQVLQRLSSAEITQPPKDHLSNQLWDHLSNQLGNELRSQLWDQLRGRLSNQLWDQLRDQISNQFWDQLSNQFWDQLWDQLSDQLSDQLRDQLSGQLRDQLSGHLSNQLGNELRSQLWGQLSDQLSDQLRDQLSGQLRDQLSNQLWGQLSNQFWDQLWGQLGDQLWGQLGDQLWGQLSRQLRSLLSQSFRGQHEYWWQFYAFIARHTATPLTAECQEKLDLWATMQRAGWWLPMKGVCIVSERPTRCSVNEAGELHAEDGPALAFADGTQVWSIGGVRVNEQIVLRPETQTLDEIKQEDNAEIKRIRIARYGWDKYLIGIGAETLDAESDIDGIHQALLQADGMTVLCVACPSSGRTYSLEVDPGCRTVADAQPYLQAFDVSLAGWDFGSDRFKTASIPLAQA